MNIPETSTRDDAGRITSLNRLIRYGLGTFHVTSTYTYRPDGRLDSVANLDGTLHVSEKADQAHSDELEGCEGDGRDAPVRSELPIVA